MSRPRIAWRLRKFHVAHGDTLGPRGTGNYRRHVMRVVAGNQLSMDFEPSVRQRFPTLRQCIHYIVLQDPRGIATVAMDCDLSESELSRRLSKRKKGDPRSCDVDLMVAIMRSTGNHLPLQWLLAEFVPNDQMRHAAAVERLEALLPEVAALVRDAKAAGHPPATRGRR